jgi:hypothetical protein
MENQFGDYIPYLFQIKFGEEKSISAFDFERSLHNYFNHSDKRPHGKYKWGEIGNAFSRDFKKSLLKFLE